MVSKKKKTPNKKKEIVKNDEPNSEIEDMIEYIQMFVDNVNDKMVIRKLYNFVERLDNICYGNKLSKETRRVILHLLP